MEARFSRAVEESLTLQDNHVVNVINDVGVAVQPPPKCAVKAAIHVYPQ